MTDKVPVLVLSGWLGAGKTTMLRHILSHAGGRRIGLLVNDMASVNVDAATIAGDGHGGRGTLRARHGVPIATGARAPNDTLQRTEDSVSASLAGSAAAADFGAAAAVHLTTEMVEFTGGCICCTLRPDFVRQLAEMAASTPRLDVIIVESSGISEPQQVAEAFDIPDSEAEDDSSDDSEGEDGDEKGERKDQEQEEFSEGEKEEEEDDEEEEEEAEDEESDSAEDSDSEDENPEAAAKAAELARWAAELRRLARLDCMVTVVDALNFPKDMAACAESLADRGMAIAEEDTRAVSELLVQQVEFANIIYVNKLDLVAPGDAERLVALLRTLAPRAAIRTCTRSAVDPADVIDVRAFDMAAARASPGWLASLAGEHVPESLEYGITNVVFRARRPFHPGRLFALLFGAQAAQATRSNNSSSASESASATASASASASTAASGSDSGSIRDDSEPELANSEACMRHTEGDSSDAGTVSPGSEPVPAGKATSPAGGALAAASGMQRVKGGTAGSVAQTPFCAGAAAGSGSESGDPAAGSGAGAASASDSGFEPDTSGSLCSVPREDMAALSRVVRSKGIAWLGTEWGHMQRLSWSQAGRVWQFAPGAPWLASEPLEEWPEGAVASLAETGVWLPDPYVGDREVEVVLIGVHMDGAAVQAALHRALLTEEEYERIYKRALAADALEAAASASAIAAAIAQVAAGADAASDSDSESDSDSDASSKNESHPEPLAAGSASAMPMNRASKRPRRGSASESDAAASLSSASGSESALAGASSKLEPPRAQAPVPAPAPAPAGHGAPAAAVTTGAASFPSHPYHPEAVTDCAPLAGSACRSDVKAAVKARRRLTKAEQREATKALKLMRAPEYAGGWDFEDNGSLDGGEEA